MKGIGMIGRVAAGVLSTAAALTAQEIDRDVAAARLTSFLEDSRELWDAPAISAAVAVGDEVFYIGSVGTADLSNARPADAATVYRIGSTSKGITATAVLQLVASGRISLDDDIREYVPEYPAKRWPITVRQVLVHTSGIRHYDDGESSRRTEHYATVAAAIAPFKDDPLRFEPGTRYGYTTYGYTLLQGVVEKASGLSYREYLRQNIFQPAGMPGSDIEVVGEYYPKRAVGYRKDDGRIGEVGFDDVSFKYAGGGMLATPTDLVRLCMALWSGDILSHELVEEMFSEQIPELDPGNGYAWGVRIEEDTGFRRVWHPGRSNGFESYLVCYPDQRVAVSVLTNQHYTNVFTEVGGLARSLTDLFLPGGVTQATQIPDRTLATALRESIEREEMESAEALFESYRDNPAYRSRSAAAELLQVGVQLLANGNAAAAAAVFAVGVEAEPENASMLEGLGTASLEQRQLMEARRNLERARAIDPGGARVSAKLELIEALGREPTFAASGRYRLESAVDLGSGPQSFEITVRLARAEDGRLAGTIETNIGPTQPIAGVWQGGDRIWVVSYSADGAFDLSIEVADTELSGRWFFGSFSGAMTGSRDAQSDG